jgi:predicted transcriptional regulator
LLAAVREAELDIDAGRLVTNEHMLARISGWAAN